MIALMAARLEEAKQDMREEGERERAFVDGKEESRQGWWMVMKFIALRKVFGHH